MDDFTSTLDPATQGEILRNQLAIVRESASGRQRSDQLAALMVLWHACFYPEAFTVIWDECQRVFDHCACSRKSDEQDLTLPLELALGVNRIRDDYRLGIPVRAEYGLWHADAPIRAWTRECLYWVTPFLDARNLFDAYVRSWQFGRCDPELATLIAFSGDGFEQLWNLRELLPSEEERLGGEIARLACGAWAQNPFARECLDLAMYMFMQSVRLSDGAAGFWRETIEDSDDQASMIQKLRSRNLVLDFRAPLLMKSRIDLSEMASCSRLEQTQRVVRCPVWIERAWYRLIEYEDGLLRVEQWQDERWDEAEEVSPGTFIARLLEDKRVT